jgi:AAHS family 4-hydroxybenzoate transporter-like MFS transporter
MSTVVSVGDVIERRPISGLQWLVYFLCGLVIFVEGYDTQSISYVAPTLSRAWGLPPGALGPIFAVGLIGQVAGALLLAPLADRFGRKPVIIAATTAFGIMTWLTGFSNSFSELFMLRLLTGVGLGAALPNAITLTAEYSPFRCRTTAVALLMCGFPLGAAGGGAVAAVLLAWSSWPAVFFAGGLVTVLLLPCLIFLLPESVRFLALSPKSSVALPRLMARIDPSISSTEQVRYVDGSERRGKVRVRELLADGIGRSTILLWIIFFVNLLDVYLLISWLPTVVNRAGLSVSAAALVTSTLLVAGVAGSFVLGPLINRFGATRVLPASFLLGAVSIASIGFVGASVPLLLITVFGAGVAVSGSQNCNNGVAAKCYTPAMGATGVGWANAIGRIGSAVGPSIGGMMLYLDADVRFIKIASAVPAVIVACTYLAMPSIAASPRRRTEQGAGSMNGLSVSVEDEFPFNRGLEGKQREQRSGG